MIRRIKETAVSLWKDEQGAALVEYSILIGIITAGVVTIVLAVGVWVGGQWTALKTALHLP